MSYLNDNPQFDAALAKAKAQQAGAGLAFAGAEYSVPEEYRNDAPVALETVVAALSRQLNAAENMEDPALEGERLRAMNQAEAAIRLVPSGNDRDALLGEVAKTIASARSVGELRLAVQAVLMEAQVKAGTNNLETRIDQQDAQREALAAQIIDAEKQIDKTFDTYSQYLTEEERIRHQRLIAERDRYAVGSAEWFARDKLLNQDSAATAQKGADRATDDPEARTAFTKAKGTASSNIVSDDKGISVYENQIKQHGPNPNMSVDYHDSVTQQSTQTIAKKDNAPDLKMADGVTLAAASATNTALPKLPADKPLIVGI